ncbi:putative aspartyl protease [Xenococcus sp. PCC 7305]|uniref:retropepsin-like aspartic protease family protein n=1 Tax=Xenococcus sp. PCC 7305 TaxID=102125 RepID=UPI0002ABA8A7|nr:retropepsin-like aspartic protease [Xenococcus sp. PCC 7305]ELS04377.1 putative aspartyl protease [Xenococcus sp. PCC 7305]
MRRIINLLILPLTVVLTPSISSAQQEHGCFMLDGTGNPINLGHLCSNNSPTQTIKTPRRHAPNKIDPDVFSVPIKRREGGTPVIDVQFNKKYTFEMLFDTGASLTIITAPMAKTLKIKPLGILPFQTASNNRIHFEIGSVTSVTAGGIISKDLDIAISPSMDIGLLGQNFYNQYDITIKYGTIEFRRR